MFGWSDRLVRVWVKGIYGFQTFPRIKSIKRCLTQTQTAYILRISLWHRCGAGWKSFSQRNRHVLWITQSWQTLVVILDRATCKCGQDIFYQLLALPFTLTTARLPLPAESIWNAASFYQESSYLYFPTLQAELASDISFYFKSGAPSGVFLENLGLKDFIRLELTCESTFTLYNRTPQDGVHGIHDKDAGRRMRACTGASRRAVRGVFIIFPSSQETRAGVALTVSFPQEAGTLSGPRSMM